MELALSHNNQIVEFPMLPITAGITTNRLNSFKSDDPGARGRINILQDLTGAKCHGQLIPNHGVSIPKFITRWADETAHGDATIYGNEEIGYLVMVHCSWITLSKDILFRIFRKLETTGFWNLGNVQAFIYPGICQACYEVGLDVLNKLMRGDICTVPYFQYLDNDKWLLNLSGYIRAILITGININDNIKTIPTCSAHSIMEVTQRPVFFSYRARQDCERNAIFAKLPDDDKLIFSTTGDCPYVLIWALPKK